MFSDLFPFPNKGLEVLEGVLFSLKIIPLEKQITKLVEH